VNVRRLASDYSPWYPSVTISSQWELSGFA
jgi:hypothetical protein